jgi:hypothetical protein
MTPPPLRPSGGAASSSQGGGGGGAGFPYDGPCFKATNRMPLDRPGDHKEGWIKITYLVPGDLTKSYLFKASFRYGTKKTDKIKFTWNNFFRSTTLPKISALDGRSYSHYDQGPLVLDIHALGEVALAHSACGGRGKVGALEKDTAFLVNVLWLHYQDYFPDIFRWVVTKDTDTAEIVDKVFPAFQRFVRMFYNQRDFVFDCESIARLMQEHRSAPARADLKDARLLLVLPCSCMEVDAVREDDRSYKWPDTRKLVMASVTEVLSLPSGPR